MGYKNLFNDFYALGLPMFVPSLGFIAQLWPILQHSQRPNESYDGWFDRKIARIRLDSEARHVPEPEPFDLDVDGTAKVLHWMRLADYFHFPGVQKFVGLAQLLDSLYTMDFGAIQVEMRQHCK